MKKMSYLFSGMAVQAFAVATLQTLSLITVTPLQQGMAGVLFLIVAGIVARIE